MRIKRYYNIQEHLEPNKALVIYGPRQVGKTTLVKNFLTDFQGRYRFVTGDDLRVREILSSENLETIKEYAEGYSLIVIDEAQKIPQIGTALKLLVDHCDGLKIIVTGSSSFELAGQIGEPLTGRKVSLRLFPLSQIELSYHFSQHDLKEDLEKFLIYGSYPELFDKDANNTLKQQLLMELTGSYLLKDILELEKVKSSKVLLDLLRLLAFQIGNEVSLNELSNNLGIDGKTVGRYLDLFEKSFIVYSLSGYSSNLRNEIKKKQKYYFYDNGVRNAIISNFNPLSLRDDIGALWENFLVMERIKKQVYTQLWSNNFFWRTWEKQEVDFVEEREGSLFGYEMKFKQKKVKIPLSWKKNYPKAKFEIISKENYFEFVLNK